MIGQTGRKLNQRQNWLCFDIPCKFPTLRYMPLCRKHAILILYRAHLRKFWLFYIRGITICLENVELNLLSSKYYLSEGIQSRLTVAQVTRGFYFQRKTAQSTKPYIANLVHLMALPFLVLPIARWWNWILEQPKIVQIQTRYIFRTCIYMWFTHKYKYIYIHIYIQMYNIYLSI